MGQLTPTHGVTAPRNPVMNLLFLVVKMGAGGWSQGPVLRWRFRLVEPYAPVRLARRELQSVRRFASRTTTSRRLDHRRGHGPGRVLLEQPPAHALGARFDAGGQGRRL